MLTHLSSFFKRKEDCSTYYKMGRILGQGSFATVRLCTHKVDGTKWAVKIIKRKALEKSDESAIVSEIQILQKVDHPNIVKLKEVYDSKTEMHIVMEIMFGGELFDRICQKQFYSEMEAKNAFRQMLAAVKYCHDMDVVHRDLKPENLLYATESEDSPLKLADFGLAHLLQPNEMMHSSCGTPAYVAPEILRSGRGGHGYGKEVDIWSLGIILYILLCGFPPFYGDDHIRLFAQIQKGTFTFTPPYWDCVSDVVKDLIRRMLTVNPARRISAEDAQAHEWLRTDSAGCSEPLPYFNENMRAFNGRRKLRKGILALQILHRFKDFQGAQADNDKAKNLLEQDMEPSETATTTTTNSGNGSGNGSGNSSVLQAPNTTVVVTKDKEESNPAPTPADVPV